ncbi:MAG: hypothetical protein AAB770_01455 [Patescibacteria group bacterium]
MTYTPKMPKMEMPLTGHSEKSQKSDHELLLKTLDVLTKKSPECAEALSSLSDEEKSEIENNLNMLGHSWTVFNVVDSSSAPQVLEKIKAFQSTQDINIRKKIISEIVDLLE